MINKTLQDAARRAATFLRKKLGIKDGVYLGIILGTGWGDKIQIDNAKSVSFQSIPGFGRLQKLHGHNRRLIYGKIKGKEVLVLQGRVHLNEDFANASIYKMVRLQTEMLMILGVKDLIVTCAAGALPNSGLKPGDLMIINGFVTVFAPQMPLRAGEFVSPEDMLSKQLQSVAYDCALNYGGRVKDGGYAMLLGPWFEGRNYDKIILDRTGAKAVGMSTLPEACIAALYGADVLGLAFITNDAEGIHSHEANMKKAGQYSDSLGKYLASIVNEHV